MSIWGVVVAAGTGSRFGGAKHEVDLGGRALWEWARDALVDSGADGVVVVGPVPGGVPGGDRRQDSVAAGLAHVPSGAAVISVHDAARPLAPAGMIKRMYTELNIAQVDGVVPVLTIQDTIKEVDGPRIARTLDRTRLVAAQTPQVFRAHSLRRAHAEIDRDATDDAAMVEAIGGVVIVVPGERAAMKITYPEDLIVAEAFLDTGDVR